MGQSETWAVIHQQFHQTGVVRKDIHRPGFNRSQYSRVEVSNLIRHQRRLANTLTHGKVTVSAARNAPLPVGFKTSG